MPVAARRPPELEDDQKLEAVVVDRGGKHRACPAAGERRK